MLFFHNVSTRRDLLPQAPVPPTTPKKNRNEKMRNMENPFNFGILGNNNRVFFIFYVLHIYFLSI